MKPNLVVLFSILCLASNTILAQDLEDKAKHFGSGFLIGGIGGYSAHKIFNGKRHWRWIGATGSSLAAAITKESWDKSRGIQPEANDVLYTVLGGLVSGITLDLIFTNKRRRNKRKNCGCLYVSLDHLDYHDKPIFIFKGDSQNVTAAIQAQYIRNETYSLQ
ncbi:MAG: hypothetical protein AB8B59_06945 [Maribacter sp.]